MKSLVHGTMMLCRDHKNATNEPINRVSLVEVQPENEESQNLHLAALFFQHAHQLRQLLLQMHLMDAHNKTRL